MVWFAYTMATDWCHDSWQALLSKYDIMCNQVDSLHMDASGKMLTNENVNPNVVNFQPPRKKAKVSTSSSGTQFKAPETNKEMVAYSKGYVPQNMQQNTAWEVKKNFRSGKLNGTAPFKETDALLMFYTCIVLMCSY